MNKRFHRVVFNAARKLKVVVQETARAAGKASGATPAVTAVLLIAMPATAQIVGAPGVPPNLRPTVLVAPNGVPLVNIQTPSAAGVSRNLYQQLDVQRTGTHPYGRPLAQRNAADFPRPLLFLARQLYLLVR